jgi:hypothetical protein
MIPSNDNWQTTVIDGTIITENQVNEIQSSGFCAPAFGLESASPPRCDAVTIYGLTEREAAVAKRQC